MYSVWLESFSWRYAASTMLLQQGISVTFACFLALACRMVEHSLLIVVSDGVLMSVSLTKSAAEKIQSLLSSDDRAGMHLRIFVSGGGCSGFQYGFSFDDQVEENDTVVETMGVRLLVDAMSIPLLDGSEVDYQEKTQGASFVIRNPNAGSTCGCGKSFTPSEEGAGCANASSAY